MNAAIMNDSITNPPSQNPWIPPPVVFCGYWSLVVNIVDDCPGVEDAVSVENGTFTWETVQEPFLKKYVHITNVVVVFSM